jgi:hypothetical protein
MPIQKSRSNYTIHFKPALLKTQITNTRIILIVIAISILSGCKKEASLPPPTVDITGIWAGRWAGDTDTDHGNLLIELLQDESELNGEIFFREDLPSLANSGIDLEGTVFGNEISFRLTAGSEYSFHGVVDGDKISGEIEYGAAWNVTLIPSSELYIIDSFDCPGRIPTYIAVDSQKIWVFDDYDDNIIQVSKQTGIEEKKLFSLGPGEEGVHSHGITSDGKYIFSSYHKKISKILINNPDELQVINTPDFNSSRLCFDGEYFRVLGFTHIYIYKLSDDGTLLSKFENHGLGSGIDYDGTNIWILQSFPEILIKYDDNGEILEAYKLPKSLDNFYNYHDLAYDGQNFWVMVSHYSADLPWEYYIYKLGNE